MSPDRVCVKYHKKGISLTIKVGKTEIFIEGNAVALKFLGELILAQAAFKDDDSFSISPHGAGNIFFNKKSKKGVCIVREEKDRGVH